MLDAQIADVAAKHVQQHLADLEQKMKEGLVPAVDPARLKQLRIQIERAAKGALDPKHLEVMSRHFEKASQDAASPEHMAKLHALIDEAVRQLVDAHLSLDTVHQAHAKKLEDLSARLHKEHQERVKDLERGKTEGAIEWSPKGKKSDAQPWIHSNVVGRIKRAAPDQHPASRSAGRPGLEERMKQLEAKMDRVLKALESREEI
jgi:hypothetical protein